MIIARDIDLWYGMLWMQTGKGNKAAVDARGTEAMPDTAN